MHSTREVEHAEKIPGGFEYHVSGGLIVRIYQGIRDTEVERIDGYPASDADWTTALRAVREWISIPPETARD